MNADKRVQRVEAEESIKQSPVRAKKDGALGASQRGVTLPTEIEIEASECALCRCSR